MTDIPTGVLPAPPTGLSPVRGPGRARPVPALPDVATVVLPLRQASPARAGADGQRPAPACVVARADYDPRGTDHTLLRSVLGPCELRRLDQLTGDRRRQEFTVARYAAKVATRTALGRHVPPESVDTGGGVFHQPLLSVPGEPGLEVSLTHTGRDATGTALALVHSGACPLGIDLEWVAPDTVAAALGALTGAERALVDGPAAARGAGTPERLALVLWSAREALSKALRIGLTVPFDVLRVSDVTWRDGGWLVEFGCFPHFRARAELLPGDAGVHDRVVVVAHPAPAPLPAIGLPGSARVEPRPEVPR
ncbi:4'-phosphopantetheinyl transferase superfamily protein [Streptomyces zhaozhouensis]|uniref:4'-phosphopantetheinyl transferase superfamily protein n=1 Tax=Streptomyces zhaozhouensis TaxID=1300267 RepID=A0A286E022_9ACTN|nr:4'-phosphopantetheinyl transferase family protein [Streptomyces zhaozhouensis]SOD64268.1 4'-phosphopantetheinyl transferase superfamily protein [Streptomyces zhaozhouensis]